MISGFLPRNNRKVEQQSFLGGEECQLNWAFRNTEFEGYSEPNVSVGLLILLEHPNHLRSVLKIQILRSHLQRLRSSTLGEVLGTLCF